MKTNQTFSVVLTAVENEVPYLFSFIDSVVKGTQYVRPEIIIRDNGLRAATRKRLTQIKNLRLVGDGRNAYFAKGINEAAELSNGYWLYIANADTQLSPDTLFQLVKAGNEHPNTVLVGPVVYRNKNMTHVSHQDLPVVSFDAFKAYAKNISVSDLRLLKKTTDILWVSGCGMLVKRSVWKRLGGFDEKFFIYWEDADMGIRIHKSGLKAVIVPKARIYHAGSATIGFKTRRKMYLLTRSTWLFQWRHTSSLGKIGFIVRVICNLLLKGGRWLLLKDELSRAYLRGVKDFFLGCFSIDYSYYE